MDVFAEDFEKLDSWQCFSLNFTINSFVRVVAIRGIGVQDTSTSFSYLELAEIGK
jgi:hypothetical protein